MTNAALPLTYPDLVCEEDLDLFAGETLSDLQTLEQDVLHIIEQEPGSNADAPDLGVGIYSAMSGTAQNLIALAATISQQLELDDRIDSCSCTVTDVTAGSEQAGAFYSISVELIVDNKVINLAYDYNGSSLQVSA